MARAIVNIANGNIGDIRHSMLTLAQFQAVNGIGWVLADGTSCTGTSYAALTGYTSLPDARGMVLRGKNNGRSDGNQDPSGERTLGAFQNQATAKNGLSISDPGHAHTVNGQNRFLGDANADGTFDARSQVSLADDANWYTMPDASSNVSLTAGDAETRMRNIAVNIFIKVN